MCKLLLFCLVFAFTLTGCEKEKQPSPTISTVSRQIIDKTTDDINKATALATERMKAAEKENGSGSAAD
ncbi:MAG: hypothetical protein ABL933_03460 [Methyloglobulus sp.]|nr:hypothetical protein [Methyloglobulus sp.]